MALYKYMKSLQDSANQQFALRGRHNTERAELTVEIPRTRKSMSIDASDVTSRNLHAIGSANTTITRISISGDCDLSIELAWQAILRGVELRRAQYIDSLPKGVAEAMNHNIFPVSLSGFPWGLQWKEGKEPDMEQQILKGDFVESRGDNGGRILHFQERTKRKIIRVFRVLDIGYYNDYQQD